MRSGIAPSLLDPYIAERQTNPGLRPAIKRRRQVFWLPDLPTTRAFPQPLGALQ